MKTGSTKILTKINHEEEEEEEDRLQDLSNSISHLVLPRVSWYGKVDAREVDGVVHPRMHQRARVPREGEARRRGAKGWRAWLDAINKTTPAILAVGAAYEKWFRRRWRW